ncbi:hypothetical protein NQZ68_037038 [Dissostichus eleginoides]|nr:hypothetical protein NQZ68_037038 [Dissostichus eleginoides]
MPSVSSTGRWGGSGYWRVKGVLILLVLGLVYLAKETLLDEAEAFPTPGGEGSCSLQRLVGVERLSRDGVPAVPGLASDDKNNTRHHCKCGEKGKKVGRNSVTDGGLLLCSPGDLGGGVEGEAVGPGVPWACGEATPL